MKRKYVIALLVITIGSAFISSLLHSQNDGQTNHRMMTLNASENEKYFQQWDWRDNQPSFPIIKIDPAENKIFYRCIYRGDTLFRVESYRGDKLHGWIWEYTVDGKVSLEHFYMYGKFMNSKEYLYDGEHQLRKIHYSTSEGYLYYWEFNYENGVKKSQVKREAKGGKVLQEINFK